MSEADAQLINPNPCSESATRRNWGMVREIIKNLSSSSAVAPKLARPDADVNQNKTGTFSIQSISGDKWTDSTNDQTGVRNWNCRKLVKNEPCVIHQDNAGIWFARPFCAYNSIFDSVDTVLVPPDADITNAAKYTDRYTTTWQPTDTNATIVTGTESGSAETRALTITTDTYVEALKSTSFTVPVAADFALAVQVRFATSSPTTQDIFVAEDTTPAVYLQVGLDVSGNFFASMQTSTGNPNVTSSVVAEDGKWYMVLVWWNSTLESISISVNGVINTDTPGATGAYGGTPGTVYLGTDGSDTNVMNGKIGQFIFRQGAGLTWSPGERGDLDTAINTEVAWKYE